MTGRTGAELSELSELRRVLGRRADDLADGARGVDAALDRFRARSSDYVPHLPPHGARGLQLAARLDELGFRAERAHDQIRHADRWAATHAAGWLHDRDQDRRAVMDVANGGWYGGRGSWSRFRRAVLDLDHPREGWKYHEVHRALGERADLLESDDIRAMRDQVNARNRAIRDQLTRLDLEFDRYADGVTPAALLRDTRADIQRVRGLGPGAVEVGEEAASRIGRTVQGFRGSRIGAVTRIGGRALGVVGLAQGAYDIYEGAQQGDTEQFVTGGLATAAGIAMMTPFPPAQLAGAIITGGLLVYEYHDEIARGARAVGRGIANGARAVADAATDHVRRQVETAGRIAQGVGDMAGAAASFVGGLF